MKTRTDILFNYFMDREGQPISTFTLERLAGRRSWRTRISEARQRARIVRRDIVNELHRVKRGRRKGQIDSFYRLVRKRAA